MIVGIHQPMYLPWLGFFHKVCNSNIFVLLDIAEYSRNNFFNRNKIKTPNGWMWITVPVIHKLGARINEVKINNNVPWQKKHWKSLRTNYCKAPFFKDYAPFFEEMYKKEWNKLIDLNFATLDFLLVSLNIKTKIVKSSKLNAKGKSTDLLINICKELGADSYLSGIGAKAYLDEEKFKDSGIKLRFQNFNHPTYPQLYGKFEPFMSIVDLLFNCGDKSQEILVKGD